MNELEEEADEEESADEDNDGAYLDDKDDPDIDQMNGEECIRYWALAEHTSHKSIRRLLRILNAKTDLNLPKDPRTLLGTLRNRATMSNIGEGKFWYHGIGHVLTKELQKYTNVPDHLHYDINIDGLPLHKRSKTQFWPILLKIVGEPFLPVLIVGIYCGESKPESNEPFLRPLVEEINSLQATGLQYNDATVKVSLRAIIADTPARAFLKGVQGHTGKHSCLKCCCEGVSVAQRIVFLNTDAPKRTDQGF
uniref:Transposase domain-containing protein n=1 Tax=Anopheles stephensi TaxID=30069 RepID=A0A182YPI6_ANOST